MEDRKRISKRVVLSAFIAAAAVGSLLWMAYLTGRDARAAGHLLNLTTGLTLGHTTRQEFLVLSEPYREYLLRGGIIEGSEASMQYRFHGHFGTPVVMAISVDFANNVVVGRDVGLLRGDCCSVETRQRLEGPMNKWFGPHRALREIIGDPQFAKFEVAPSVSGQSLRDIFDYRTECLLPFHDCGSVERINPHAVDLLRESVNAGY